MHRFTKRLAVLALTLLWPAVISAQTSFSSFEVDMEGWTPDATDLQIGDGEIEWHVKRTNLRAAHGAWSIENFMDNRNDAGKVWIERPFAVPPGDYDVVVSYKLGSQTFGEVGAFSILTNVTSYDPEVRTDLGGSRGTTYNGGIRDWV